LRRLPRSIRILGHRVGVVQVENLTYTVHVDGADDHHHDAWGLYEEYGPIITLDSLAGPERKKVTLIHETLHAAMSIAHIDEATSEEQLVTRLAPVLFDIIRNNKGLVSYLQEV
jgi:hypothetical protein